MKVFISHITEDAELASVLKGWIESTFLGQVEVFVSEYDISSGEQWFGRLGEELTDAKAMVVLCSERSVSSPWINFEVGAGHVKGVPVIPICYAGVSKDTLPAPLFFFQALDVQAANFGMTVIGDLAMHLGYTRTPPIRYEELAADLAKALSYIEGEPESNLPADLGFLDHIVLFEDKTEALAKLIAEFGENTDEMTIATSKFSDQVEKATNSPSSGTPRHIQRIIKKFGEYLSNYAGNIEDINQKYGEILPEIKSILRNILTFQDLEAVSDADGVDKFLTTLDETEQSVSDWKNLVVYVNGIINGLPNIQRDMVAGAQRVSEQFETLASNLDDSLDMIQEARATYNSRFEHRRLEEEL